MSAWETVDELDIRTPSHREPGGLRDWPWSVVRWLFGGGDEDREPAGCTPHGGPVPEHLHQPRDRRGGGAIARMVGQRLGWKVYDHELLEAIAHRMELPVDDVRAFDELAPSVVQDWLLAAPRGALRPPGSLPRSPGQADRGHRPGRRVGPGRPGRGVHAAPRDDAVGPDHRPLARSGPCAWPSGWASRCAPPGGRPETSIAAAPSSIARCTGWCRPIPHNYDMVLDSHSLGLDIAAEVIVRAVEAGRPGAVLPQGSAPGRSLPDRRLPPAGARLSSPERRLPPASRRFLPPRSATPHTRPSSRPVRLSNRNAPALPAPPRPCEQPHEPPAPATTRPVMPRSQDCGILLPTVRTTSTTGGFPCELVPRPRPSPSSRRDFLTTSAGTAAAGAALRRAPSPRGATRARTTPSPLPWSAAAAAAPAPPAQALSTKGPTQLVAMADVFEDRLKSSLDQLNEQHSPQLDVPPDRQFLGMDAYRKAIDCVAPGGVVLLATPPAFRPIHVEYAVSKGCHVFMEKSFAVDAPGIRRIFKAGEEAKTEEPQDRRRPDEPPLQAAGRGRRADPQRGDRRGDHLLRLPRCTARSASRPKAPGESELAHQIRNYSQLHLAQRQLPARLADPQPRRLLLGQGRLAGLGPGPGRPAGPHRSPTSSSTTTSSNTPSPTARG